MADIILDDEYNFAYEKESGWDLSGASIDITATGPGGAGDPAELNKVSAKLFAFDDIEDSSINIDLEGLKNIAISRIYARDDGTGEISNTMTVLNDTEDAKWNYLRQSIQIGGHATDGTFSNDMTVNGGDSNLLQYISVYRDVTNTDLDNRMEVNEVDGDVWAGQKVWVGGTVEGSDIRNDMDLTVVSGDVGLHQKILVHDVTDAELRNFMDLEDLGGHARANQAIYAFGTLGDDSFTQNFMLLSSTEDFHARQSIHVSGDITGRQVFNFIRAEDLDGHFYSSQRMVVHGDLDGPQLVVQNEVNVDRAEDVNLRQSIYIAGDVAGENTSIRNSAVLDDVEGDLDQSLLVTGNISSVDSLSSLTNTVSLRNAQMANVDQELSVNGDVHTFNLRNSLVATNADNITANQFIEVGGDITADLSIPNSGSVENVIFFTGTSGSTVTAEVSVAGTIMSGITVENRFTVLNSQDSSYESLGNTDDEFLISSSSSENTLIGGAGNDEFTLTATVDDTLFIFRDGSGVDEIFGYDADQDGSEANVIDLQDYGSYDSITYSDIDGDADSDDALIDIDGTNMVTVYDVGDGYFDALGNGSDDILV